MHNKPITPTSKDISPEEIDKAVEKFYRKYDRRLGLLCLHPYDFRMLKVYLLKRKIFNISETGKVIRS